MVTIAVARDRSGPVSLRVSGHAGQADAGRDLVCAAVSALVETLALGLADVAPGQPPGQIDPGLASFAWTALNPAQRVVVDTILAGLRDLADSYPQFVRWFEQEKAPNGDA